MQEPDIHVPRVLLAQHPKQHQCDNLQVKLIMFGSELPIEFVQSALGCTDLLKLNSNQVGQH